MKKSTILIISTLLAVIIGVFYFTGYSHAPVTDESPAVQNEEINTNEIKNKNTSSLKISEEESSVEFSIGEILNGKDFTAKGMTNKISGDISFSKKDDSSVDVSIKNILVDARDFKTDSENRDKAISGFILRSKNNENFNFIKFTPDESIVNMTPGVKKNFELSGDLTISGITKKATFNLALIFGEDTLSGEANTKIKRSDFDLKVPSVPFVAEVNDEFNVDVKILAK